MSRPSSRTEPPTSSLFGEGSGPAPTHEGQAPSGSARVFVSDLRKDQRVAGAVFLVISKSLRSTQSGNAFLALELRDRTGRIQARLWDNAEALQSLAVLDGFVRLGGHVSEYGGLLQVNINELEAVAVESVDLADFLPASTRDPGTMEAELRGLVAGIVSTPLRTLAESFFGDPEFWPLFRRCPAAKQIHHAVLGGLLEHSLAVAGLCLDMAGRYPPLDRDLLLTGALLHDLGKVRELSWTRRFDYTDEGQLIGHVVLGAEMVSERAAKLTSPPDPETLLRLRHMILSHHGQYEWGSPKRPMTLEAVALHYADDLDGKLNTVEDTLRTEGERDPDSRWTPYHRTLDRYLYKGSRGDGR